METKRWLVPAPVERLPALFLALIATAMVFAAINAGFSPHGAAVAGWEWRQASADVRGRA